jgi:cytosine/adenosine deaminase-related metal-dependent hydrolase
MTAFVNGFIVLPEGESRFTALRFNAQAVLSLDQPPQRGEAVHDLAGYAVYPGLVNAHDHLEFNHYPRTKFRPVYANAKAWGQDFTPRLNQEPFLTLRRAPLATLCEIGALKNLRAGVTTVAHHNPLHTPLRAANYPIRVLQNYGWAHSLYLERRDLRATYRETPPGAAWFIHLAEGMDEDAASELSELERLGLLQANTVLIHGVGLRPEDHERVLQVGAGLVWCPSSNLFLLGQTAAIREFAEAQRLALGSDSRLTADGNLLDELRAAAATGQATPLQLFRAVTTDAAALIRTPRVGSLYPGQYPDFFVTSLTEAIQRDPYAALIDLRPEDIQSVWVRGVIRLQN